MIHNNRITALDKARSLPLGVYTAQELKGFDKVYINHTEKLPAESKILFYTDGLTEARSQNMESGFFEERMYKILPRLADRNCRDFIHSLYKELVIFRGSENFEDDVCLVCVDID